MKLISLSDRVVYAVRMMRLARWMAGRLADDYERRIVGRMVLIFVPIYVEAAFGLLKQPGMPSPDRVRLREGVRTLQEDFAEFHDRIRHDLAAHRDDLPLDAAIEAWNEIDSDTLAWFCEAADENICGIVDSHTLLSGAVTDFNSQSDPDLALRLEAPPEGGGDVRISTDALALTRGHIAALPIHEVQDRASVLMSVHESLNACKRILEAVGRDLPCFLLLKSMFVIDTINLVDGIYGEAVGASRQRSTPFLGILEEGEFGGAELLRQSVESVDLEAVEAVRSVRNRACAHLDSRFSLRELQDLIIDLDNAVLINRVIAPAWQALNAACAQDRATCFLLMNSESRTAIGVSSTPGVRAFDR